ncbi:hypothetical protein E5676_scaffold318G00390 [Cucumis melo var. makuwa]|uniref:Uncharacterized protein n=1 Tax=Cucumis melo var. makuwa TaxID=1194695 RepID=A0A5A7UYY2_CUCMM|nr:hypothetical protein E6C27_scaffold22G00900 [Cucumis melo var. makuwa]TYK22060.1 hypothetical protein E5676_scaffold318G00390 [Cucumis melo var. makuwa]
MDLEAQLVNPDARRAMEEELFDRVAQRLLDGLSKELKNKYEIEGFMALGAKEFLGSRTRASREVVKNTRDMVSYAVL